jgi:hypothetical protein
LFPPYTTSIKEESRSFGFVFEFIEDYIKAAKFAGEFLEFARGAFIGSIDGLG